MFVTNLTLADAKQLCNRLDKCLGIPPEGLEGIGGPGRTMRWAEPIPLADGTYAVPVPKKGRLKDLLDALRDRKSESALTDDRTDSLSGQVTPKVISKANLKEVIDLVATARKLDPSELKTDTTKDLQDVKA